MRLLITMLIATDAFGQIFRNNANPNNAGTRHYRSKNQTMSFHIDSSHLRMFALGHDDLTGEEESHLLHCDQCRTELTKATLEQLKAITAEEAPPYRTKI